MTCVDFLILQIQFAILFAIYKRQNISNLVWFEGNVLYLWFHGYVYKVHKNWHVGDRIPYNVKEIYPNLIAVHSRVQRKAVSSADNVE